MLGDQPSALSTASVNDWLFFLNKCSFQPSIGIEKLQLFLSLIQSIENLDGQSLAEANDIGEKLVAKLSSFLKNLITWFQPLPNLTNSLVKGDFLSDADKLMIGSFTSTIFKPEEKKATPRTFNAKPDPFLTIPLLPPRQIEADAMDIDNKLWQTNTMNYPAPFTTDSLLLLFNCDNVEYEVCKAFAVKGKHLLAKDMFFDLGIFYS